MILSLYLIFFKRSSVSPLILKFLSFSPTIGSKVRKLYSAIQTKKFNEDVIKEMSYLDWENPIYPDVVKNN